MNGKSNNMEYDMEDEIQACGFIGVHSGSGYGMILLGVSGSEGMDKNMGS